MIGLSIDYQLADSLIAYLAADPDLSDMVYASVLDTSSQAAALNITARAHKSCLCVSVGDASPTYPDASARPGVMDVQLIVSLLTVNNVTSYPAPHKSLLSYSTAVMGRVIRLAERWSPDDIGIPYARPRVVGVSDMDLSRMSSLVNVSGRAVIITIPVKF